MIETTIRLTRPNSRAPGQREPGEVLVAAGTPYGDIAVGRHADPDRLVVAAAGLPATELVAPTRETGIRFRCVSDETRLTVGGLVASFEQRASGFRRGQRALRIWLGERAYRWQAVSLISADRLIAEDTGPIAGTGWRSGNAIVTLTPAATPGDAALAIILCAGLDSDALRLFRIFAP
jgi:hypothetical protein